MSILEWLGRVLTELFPPWELIPHTHTGVRQRNIPLPIKLKKWLEKHSVIPEGGNIRRDCGSGFVFSIPFLDEIWELPVTFESEDLDNIEVETRDGLVYDVSPVLTWKVKNPLKACFAVSNYQESLHNDVRAALVEWANKQTGRINVATMARECTEIVCREERIATEWGCVVKCVTINSCARPWETHELIHKLVRNDA